MEFKHALERWHKIREFSVMLSQYAEFKEIKEINKCIHYEFDNQSAEEYCHHPSKLGEYGAAFGLNGKSDEICWQCPKYEVQKDGGQEDGS